MSKLDQSREQGAPFGRRQIFFAQAEPAAAASKHRLGDREHRPARLAAIGDNQNGRVGQIHRRGHYWVRRAEQQISRNRDPDNGLAGLGDRRRHRHCRKARHRLPAGLGIADAQIAIAQHREVNPVGN